MDLKEAQALGAQADHHWYYVSKARMMAQHIGPVNAVLDVGAGLGWFSRWMLREGMAQTATCVDPGYSEDHDEVEAGKPLLLRREVAEAAPDVVLMMDVLEHVDDDVGLLSRYLDLVPAGTQVFITVPAFEFLWSNHDVYLDHRRRYTHRRLKQTILDAGATPTALHYYFGSIFPAAAAVRLLRRKASDDHSDMGPMPALTNGMLKVVCSAERAVMRINRLMGLSVVAVCSRPA